MSTAITVSTVGVVLLVVAGSATARPVADCNRARSAAERAVCADPHLAAADSEMATAYTALHVLLPTAQHAALLDNQREWIAQRDGACQDKGLELTQCLLEQTQARRRYLAGEGPKGDPGALRLLPAFYREAAAHYKISIAYPQVPGSAGAITASFNKESGKIAFGSGPGGATAFRNDEPLPDSDAKIFYDVSYEITYLDAHLASVVFSIATYEGGAHPSGESIGLLFDLHVFDTRTRAEFTGEDARNRARSGHLPGARHLSHVDLLENGLVRSAPVLRAMLERAGFGPGDHIVTHCEGGGRAALGAAAAVRAGFDDVRVYYLSFGDWVRDESCPVVRD